MAIALAACEPNATPQPASDASLPACVPNRDGMITADELPIALGASLPFYAGSNRMVNLTAQNGVYDLSQQNPDDVVVEVGPVGLGSQWYAAAFPNGQFVVASGGGLAGVYHQDATALWLDGTASELEAPPAGQTLVAYAEPMAILRFPLHDGQSYRTIQPLDHATIDGLPLQGSDEIDVDVALGARLDLPYVEFSPVMRVRINAIRTPSTGTPIVNQRTTEFLFECFGEVARAVSNEDEPNADFTAAAYERRYALGESP